MLHVLLERGLPAGHTLTPSVVAAKFRPPELGIYRERPTGIEPA
jgi:hypothetical protein